jgi:hypothetical protein
MTANRLKVLACFTMLIDHIGAVLFDDYIIFRIIGRISFPIFAFLIVEGYMHTSNIYKYLLRLFTFALISEIPFDLAFYNQVGFVHQNVFFTLFLGLLALHLYETLRGKDDSIAKFVVFIIGVIAIILRTDYMIYGILMIFSLYLYKNNIKKSFLLVALINGLMVLSNWLVGFTNFRSSIQIFALISLIFIYYYNNQRGKKIKYIFYLFYPVHLMLIYYFHIYC